MFLVFTLKEKAFPSVDHYNENVWKEVHTTRGMIDIYFSDTFIERVRSLYVHLESLSCVFFILEMFNRCVLFLYTSHQDTERWRENLEHHGRTDKHTHFASNRDVKTRIYQMNRDVGEYIYCLFVFFHTHTWIHPTYKQSFTNIVHVGRQTVCIYIFFSRGVTWLWIDRSRRLLLSSLPELCLRRFQSLKRAASVLPPPCVIFVGSSPDFCCFHFPPRD